MSKLSASAPNRDLRTEEWRPVTGLDSRYQVSSEGKVRNEKGVIKPFLAGNKASAPYWYVHLRVDKKQKNVPVHRLVAIAFCERSEGHL